MRKLFIIMKIQFFISLFLLVFCVFACKKTKPTTSDQDKKSNYELLIDGKWIRTAATIDPPLQGIVDIFASFADCAKDDTMYFKKDSIFIVNNGAKKCFASDSQNVEYKWFLIKETDISINNDIQRIKEFTDKKLITEAFQKIGNTNHKHTTTYTNVR
jgi:hypothetical protein